VSAGGVDVSGLTVEQAAAKIDASFRGRLERNVQVRAAKRTLRLSADGAGFEFDHVRTAKRALYAGREKPGDVPLAITHSKRAVNAFAAKVQRATRRRARNATLRITTRRMIVRRARIGAQIDGRALAGAISAALENPAASRQFRPGRARVLPRVNVNDLRRQYGTVITVSRSTFKLRLFKGLKHARTYRVAVGLPGYTTPAGRFRIQSKQVNPVWSVPNSPWAGELAGSTVRGGSAANPLRARWMGVSGPIGIHGTAASGSIGSRASRGCIRMHVGDVISLYRRVPLGATVLIT
jgi:lipoprotein-anchoring transpeptidase ErfK/SrfK